MPTCYSINTVNTMTNTMLTESAPCTTNMGPCNTNTTTPTLTIVIHNILTQQDAPNLVTVLEGGTIDLSTAYGLKLMEKGSAKLNMQFDCTAATVALFTNQLHAHTEICCWYKYLYNIMTVVTVNGTPCSILTKYGNITVSDIMSHFVHTTTAP